jgi:hypothetical protein
MKKTGRSAGRVSRAVGRGRAIGIGDGKRSGPARRTSWVCGHRDQPDEGIWETCGGPQEVPVLQQGDFPRALTHLALISAAFNLDRAVGA